MVMGNAVMANLMDIIDTKIDVIPPNEIQVRNSLTMNNQILISLVDERNEWDNSENGHTLRRSIAILRRSEKYTTTTVPTQEELNANNQLCQDIENLKEERVVITAKLSKCQTKK